MTEPADPRISVLVIAPMPVFPTSAGNRKRLLLTCDALHDAGFAVDFAYFAHEDQIYRRFGINPPTDEAAMAAYFRESFRVDPKAPVPLKTRSKSFELDDWCPDELGEFVTWYVSHRPKPSAVLVNYVFLSRCLDVLPRDVLKIIDTHDRFADRQLQYLPFRAEPNFFYTTKAAEAVGLSRADLILSIQAEEGRYFGTLTDRPIIDLSPAFACKRDFVSPTSVKRFGFIGHGNDANLFSVSKLSHAWTAAWREGFPTLVIAGEICRSLGSLALPGVEMVGYVDRVDDFYQSVDVTVAPMLMGSGLKMKVVESLSYGVPVISTVIGFEGIQTDHAAHRCTGIDDVVSTMLALKDDSVALATLTEGCRAVYARYNEESARAHQDLKCWIVDKAPVPCRVPDVPRTVVLEERSRFQVGAILYTRVRSDRSDLVDDPDIGVLIATARDAPSNAPGSLSMAYTPYRDRWFAKRAMPTTSTDSDVNGQARFAARLALSPHLMGGDALASEDREAIIACLMGSAAPDWSAEASLVGLSGGTATIAATIPSLFASADCPVSTYILEMGQTGMAKAATLAIHPLARPLASRFEDRSNGYELAPIPAVMTLRCRDALKPISRILMMTHDLFGFIDLVEGPFVKGRSEAPRE